MFVDGLNKEDEQLVKIVKRVKEGRKVSFQDIVEGQSKSLGAEEKEQLLNIVVKGEDDMFLQSIEEEQNFNSFEKDGEGHKAKNDEDEYEML